MELNNLRDVPVALMADYDLLILGIPTWDFGQLQEDWEEQWDALDSAELGGKVVALYGMGDQLGYGEWFLDAMGMLKDKLASHEVQFIGAWPNQGYDFDASKALNAEGDSFVGLALDDDNQWKLTDERIQSWCVQILEQYATLISG